MLRAGLLNFSKGVLSERLHGRVDVAAYNAGLKRGDNVIVLKQGAFQIRPGFRLVSQALNPDERLVPFQFSLEQPYALAFAEGIMQPLTNGGVVLEEELVIAGATNTNPMVLEVQNHGMSVGDQVFIRAVDGALGDVINERIWNVVAAADDDHFSIDLDGTGLPAFTGSTGGIVRPDPPPPPPPVPPTPPPYIPPEEPPVFGGGEWRFPSNFEIDIR